MFFSKIVYKLRAILPTVFYGNLADRVSLETDLPPLVGKEFWSYKGQFTCSRMRGRFLNKFQIPPAAAAGGIFFWPQKIIRSDGSGTSETVHQRKGG